MNNAQLLQEVTSDFWKNIGSLHWAYSNDSHLYEKVTGLRVLTELHRRLTKDEQISQLEAQVILRVSAFVKQNPRASEAQLADLLKKEFAGFASAAASV